MATLWVGLAVWPVYAVAGAVVPRCLSLPCCSSALMRRCYQKGLNLIVWSFFSRQVCRVGSKLISPRGSSSPFKVPPVSWATPGDLLTDSPTAEMGNGSHPKAQP